MLLLFLNTTTWLGGTFLFMHLEATNEAEHKCGVKKVQRDFVDILWQESRFFDELDWKSSARKRIMQFEDQIHEAVAAGVSSASGAINDMDGGGTFTLHKLLLIRSECLEYSQHICLRVHTLNNNW